MNYRNQRTQRNQDRKPRMPAIQSRYIQATRNLRRINPKRRTKELDQEIAHTIKKIEDYGFKFFPNHYVFDDVVKLEGLVEKLQNNQPA